MFSLNRNSVIVAAAAALILLMVAAFQGEDSPRCGNYNSTLFEKHEETALRGFGDRDNTSIEDFSYWMWAHIETEHLECFFYRFGQQGYYERQFEKENRTYVLLNNTGFELLEIKGYRSDTGGSTQ